MTLVLVLPALVPAGQLGDRDSNRTAELDVVGRQVVDAATDSVEGMVSVTLSSAAARAWLRSAAQLSTQLGHHRPPDVGGIPGRPLDGLLDVAGRHGAR